MREVRFHVITPAEPLLGASSGQQTIALLKNCLSRQGFQTEARAWGLSVLLPEGSAGNFDAIFLAMNAEALSTTLAFRDSAPGGRAVVAACARPARVLQEELALADADVATVDAEGIAEQEGADPVAALLAGAVRTVPFLDAEAMGAAIWSAWDRCSPYAARAALRAYDAALAQTQSAPGAVMTR